MLATARGEFARLSVRLGVAGLVALGGLNLASAQSLISTSLTIKEVGRGPNPTIELEFPFNSFFGDVLSLSSPSGEDFNAASILEDRLFSDLIKTFPSLDEAFTFVAGTWHGTRRTSPFGNTETSFEFSVDLVSPDAVYRGLPEHVSLEDGGRIRSGQTFLLSWDYPASEPVHQTSLQIIPQFPTGRSGSLRTFSTPRPGSSSHASGSTGTGARYFATDFQSEPGTSENRFLTKFTASDLGLPLDVQLTFGASTSLNAAVANEDDGDSNPFNNPPGIGLRYLRTADPFEVTVISVPEPPAYSIAMISLALAFALAGRRR
jgi:hypothetical protein